MFVQFGIETFFSFNNMPQTVSETKHSIEEGWLKKMKCHHEIGVNLGDFCRNSLRDISFKSSYLHEIFPV